MEKKDIIYLYSLDLVGAKSNKSTMIPLKSFDNIGQNQPIVLMIRHAERFNIERMVDATQPTLTDKGKQDAYMLGQELSFLCPCSIYYSPVKRCQETAEQINLGMQSSHCDSSIAGYHLTLGGPYIKGDWNAIASLVDRIGQNEFIRQWFNGSYPPDMILPLAEAADLQLSFLIGQIKNNHRSSINITHDWNIMVLREYYLGIKHEDSGSPDFLDGLYLYKADNGISLNSPSLQKSVSITGMI